MAKRTTSKQPESKELSPTDLQQAIVKVDRRIAELESFDVETITERHDAKAIALQQKIDDTIGNIFGYGTVEYRQYKIWPFDTLPYVTGRTYPLLEVKSVIQKGIDNALIKLKSLRETLQEKLQDSTDSGIDENATYSPDTFSIIENLCERFHLIVRQIKNRHDNRSTLVVEDEYDVQDLLHVLLKLHFEDIRPEEWTPSYAGGHARMDFLLKQEQIVIEVKKTRKALGAKEVGEQLIIDITKYKEHPDCKTLFCFVYDPKDRIANPRGIENDLNRDDGRLPVRVLITPR